jgi:hypothetical protein
MNLLNRGLAACLLLFPLLCCGCGSDGRGAKLAPVQGRVIYKNEGVTAASIFFHPDAARGNNGSMASAILQEDGSFTMETYPRGNGVAPGAYKVTFDLGRRKDKELDKYRKVDTTPLTYDVPEEGLRDLLIDLGKDVKDDKESKEAKDSKGAKRARGGK